MKGLKLWQALLLIFSSICLATGGVVLYTYLTNGFGSQIVEPAGIAFNKNVAYYNGDLNQLEVDSDFSLVVKATNAGVTEKGLTLSFAKSSSNKPIETYIYNGITYISNGIISIPQNAVIGEKIPVLIDKVTYDYSAEGFGIFDANAGGITTIFAKSTNILDSKGTQITVAVDVPVEKIGLKVIDTTTKLEYPINESGVSKVLQNSNFDIQVNYYPKNSEFRYSDHYYKSFHGKSEFKERFKSYCYEITSGEDVEMHYNDGNVFFSSTSNLTSGNRVKTFAFATAKKQEEFEKENPNGEGQIYYNSMLSYLAKNTDSVLTSNVNFSIEQAEVGNVHILNTSFDNVQTNRLFTLTANNNRIGDGSLGLSISNTEGANLSSMISQVGLKVSYKKLGETEFTLLGEGDDTVIIKSASKILLGNTIVDNPYNHKGQGVYYYFSNTSVKDLNNAYWEISTNETSITIQIEVVLFRTVDSVTSIFDPNGDTLLTGETRTATINVTEKQESDVAWKNTNEQLNIIYSGNTQVPTQIDLASNVQIPSTNTYQKVQYYVAKILNGKNEAVEDIGGELTPVQIGAEDANVDMNSTYEFEGVTFALVTSSDLLFRRAGTYYVMFATVRTDAYGNVIDGDDGVDGTQFILEKYPQTPMTVIVSETLQTFKETQISLTEDNMAKYGVFERVKPSDVVLDGSKTYYTYDESTHIYTKAINLQPDVITYYEISYFAIKTGTENAIVLDIIVSESDCTMIDKEIESGKLKFFAVSGDGLTKVQLEKPADNGPRDLDNDGNMDANVKSLLISIPDDLLITGEDGTGKGFYILTEYDNTVEVVRTTIEVEDDYAKTVKASETESYNCFMLYTPEPSTIEAPEFTYNVELPGGATDTIIKNLKDKTISAEISMNSQALYTNCKIKDGENVVHADGVNGKEWLNGLIKGTKVFDAYGRIYLEKAEGSEYPFNVTTSGIANSVTIVNNDIEFLSGKESVLINVSAGGGCYYSFTINTNSNGLKQVVVGTGANQTTEKNVNNLHYIVSGEKNGSNTFDNIIQIQVGEINASGTYTTLSAAYTFFYLDPTMFEEENRDLLEMFEFNDGAVSLAAGNLNEQTPIDKYIIRENFAREATLKFIVEGKNTIDTRPAPVRFAFSLNIEAYESAEINFYDAIIYNDDNALEDGVYAGVSYSLNELVKLTSDKNWTTGTYGLGKTYYINDGGELEVTKEANKVYVGELNSGGVKFYDVAKVTPSSIKLYYFNQNKYAYNTEITYNIYPNIKIEYAVDGGTGKVLDTLNYISLANGNSDNVSNHIKWARIRGAEAIKAEIRILEGQTNVVKIDYADATNHKFTNVVENGQKKILNLGYNEYDKEFVVGAFLNDERISDINGINLEKTLKLIITEDKENFLSNILYNYDLGQTNGKVKPVNYNGVDALRVKSEKPFYPNITDQLFSSYYISIANYTRTYTKTINGLSFAISNSGFHFGNDYYIYLEIKDSSNENTIAYMKVPVFISSVGMELPYYENYNLETEDFDLATLLNGKVDGEGHIFPYANFTAGKQVQIVYIDEDYENEGLYCGVDFNLDLTFVEGDFSSSAKENEYARIIYGSDGKYYIQFANLSNEEVYITIYVTHSSGNASQLQYTYRIKITPNMKTDETYPFAEGENGAEYVFTENSADTATVDFANVLGGNAGDKANATRFNLNAVAGAEKSINISEKDKYYVLATTDKLVKNANETAYLLKAGAKLLNKNGTEISTIPCDVVLANVGEEETLITGSTDLYREVIFSAVNYRIKEISVGGNSADSATGVVFDEFVDGETKSLESIGITYSIKYEIAENGTKTFAISSNETIIGELSFTDEGILTYTKINNSFFINLIVEKTYSNVVNATSYYRYNINNTKGIDYIEYSTESASVEEIVTDGLQKASTAISGNAELTLLTKFTAGNGTSNTDLMLTVNATLTDRKGQPATLDKALSKAQVEIDLNNEKTNNSTNYGVLLRRNRAGNYSLYINRAGFVNQDYTLTLTFIASPIDVSVFKVKIKGSLTATLQTGIETPILKAGTTIDKTALSGQYSLSGAAINNVADVENEVDYISGTSIAAMKTSVEEIVLDLVLNTSQGESYISLPFRIEKNITEVRQVNYGPIYAGLKGTKETTSFYNIDGGTGVNGGVLKLTKTTVPANYMDYIESVKEEGANIEFVTQNIEKDVPNVRIDLEFTYTFGEFSFTLNSALSFNLFANAELTANYPNPNPLDEEEANLEYESVYLNDTYTNFFSSIAPFAEKRRIEIKDLTGSKPVNTNNAKITVKQISGIKVNFPDITVASGEVLVISPEANMDYEIAGLNVKVKFEQFGAFAEGYVVFEIEYNKVKIDYKVYAFGEVVETIIVNSVNSANGTEEIFLEQLDEGNVLAENVVAKITLDPVLESGNYFIKLNNPNDDVNPYHWVGFKYDATKGNTFYVFLGEMGTINEEDINKKGYVIGIYSSKTAPNDLRSLSNETTLSLTSFLNLRYKTHINGETTSVAIAKDYDYTYVMQALKGEAATDVLPATAIYKIIDESGNAKYYKADRTEVNITGELTKILLGKYKVYDSYVTLNDDSVVMVSSIDNVVVTKEANGFGQIVEKTGKKLGTTTKDMYSFGAEDDVNYVEADKLKEIYSGNKLTENFAYALHNQSGSIDGAVVKLINSTDPLADTFNASLTLVYDSTYVYVVNIDTTKYPTFNVYNTYSKSNVIEGNYSLKESTTANFKYFYAGIVSGKFGYNNGIIFASNTEVTSYGENYYQLVKNEDIFGLMKAQIYYDNGIEMIQPGISETYDSTKTYYINVDSVQTDATYNYKYVLINGTKYYFANGLTGTATMTINKLFVKTTVSNIAINASTTEVLITANGENPSTIVKTPTIRQLTDKTGEYVTISGTKFLLVDKTADQIQYLTAGNNVYYTARIEKTGTTYPFDYYRTGSTLDFLKGDELRIIAPSGQEYLISGIVVPQGEATNIVLAGTITAFKNVTTIKSIASAQKVDDTYKNTIGGVDYYFFNGQYIHYSDVNTIRYAGTDYYLASMETFTVNDVQGLVIGEEVSLSLKYLLGNHDGDINFKFRIKVDVAVENEISGTEFNELAKQLDINDTLSVNYVEIETNKIYDFNEIVGVIRPSNGDIIQPEDVRSSANMKLEIVDKDTITDATLIKIKNYLDDELRDNDDEIRFSYELVRTNNKESGAVYNFKVTPLGADNNGDFILVKYTYTIAVGEFIGTDEEEYSIEKYLLFKILPDYKVTMIDLSTNPVVVLEERSGGVVTKVSNKDNPIQITDFNAIGEFALSDETFSQIMARSINVASPDTATYYLIESGISMPYGFGKVYNSSLNQEVPGTGYTQLLFKESYVKTPDTTVQAGKEYWVYDGSSWKAPVSPSDLSVCYEKLVTPNDVVYYISNGDIVNMSKLKKDATLYKAFDFTTNTPSANAGTVENLAILIDGVKKSTESTYEISSDKDGLSYAYGHGKQVLESSGNDAYTKLKFKVVYVKTEDTTKQTGKTYYVNEAGTMQVFTDASFVDGVVYYESVATPKEEYYFMQTSYIDRNKISSSTEIAMYENINLPISTKSDASMLKVTAQNATNSKKNISAIVFEATEPSLNGYLTKVTETDAKIIKYIISQEVKLGQINYKVTFTDKYGYTIDFYFSLVAPSNPRYAAGSLEYTEGDTFDIGAQYELIQINEYTVGDTQEIYYPAYQPKEEDHGTSRTNDTNDPYYVFTEEYDYKALLSSFWQTGRESGKRYFTFNGVSYIEVQAGVTLVEGVQYYEYMSVYKHVNTLDKGFIKDVGSGKYARDQILGTTFTVNKDLIYYKKLNGKTVNNTPNTLTSLNIPYGLNDEKKQTVAGVADPHIKVTGYTTMYLSSSSTNFMYIPTALLQIQADGISTVVYSPESDSEDTTIVQTYKDTIELTGIKAFGYEFQNINANTVGAAGSEYFTTGCDLDNITIESVGYYFNGEKIIDPDGVGVNKALASSNKYYKYYSTNKIGRYINRTNYTIPTMPGWIYGDKDSAFVELRITMQLTGGETYTLPIEIKVTKASPKIITESSVATNVSDDTQFNLDKHINLNDKAINLFYDDTIAITLPASGSVTVNVKAVEKGVNAGKEFSGEQTVSSTDFVDMDYTYYVGLSQIVGHTLDENYDISVEFTKYNNTFVTRDGNFGFYANYKQGLRVATGNDGTFAATTEILTKPAGGTLVEDCYYYTYSLGKVLSEDSYTEFTSITYKKAGGAEEIYIVPTEKIVVGSGGISDKVEAGARYVKEDNFKKSVDTKSEFTSFNLSEITTDKLHLADVGNLANGVLKATKYYVVKSRDNKYYQFVKNYNIYPKYFEFETDDVNDRVDAEANTYTATDTVYTFNLASWANDVFIKYYDQYGELKTVGLDTAQVKALYFELGDKDTTSASIDGVTGEITVDKSKYILNGEQYITVKIFVKASGENAEFIDDRYVFSGNDRNSEEILVRVYLNDKI